jgi:DNA-binding HxlR family transcriptional regulator
MGDVAVTHQVQPTRPSSMRSHRRATPLAQALAAAGDRWTLLIVLACSDGTVRLNTLRNRLPGVSSAVLDHHVRQMVALGLLTRRRFREMPPRVELTLTDSGVALLPIAAALARWGMRYRWSEQELCEHIDASAILCQLPALLDDTTLSDGVLEAVIDDGEELASYRFQTVAGKLQPIGPTTGGLPKVGSVGIKGDRAAWNAALGPQRDYARLRLTGRGALARQVLDALPAPSTSASR